MQFIPQNNSIILIITLIFVILTVFVSFQAFNDNSLKNKLVLYPRIMDRPSEYYRLLTSGFIHDDFQHLLFNMFTLYFFGRSVFEILSAYYASTAVVYGLFIVLYTTGIIISSLPAMVKHKNNSNYHALGASGGVSAFVFFVIYYVPWGKLTFFFFPMKAIVFGILYVIYSIYMSKRGNDNIGHEAHLGGALYGITFALVIDPTHGQSFINQLMHPIF